MLHSERYLSPANLGKDMTKQKTYLVISALGEDHPGIVNQISKTVLEHGCNIEDSRMTVLGGEFAAILLVEGKWNTLAKIENALPELERQLGMTIISKRTGERATGRNLLPYAVDVVSMDHPGIVNNLAGFFAERKINIEDMSTSTYAAAHTGTTMFAVHMTVGIPSDMHIAGLREEFMDYCDGLNLDAVLEPIKG
jgi:glycine cleavage system transcriptional repressor